MDLKARQYVLSPHYRLLSAAELGPADNTAGRLDALARVRSGAAFVLRNDHENKSMLITPLIRQFLTAFTPAAGIEQVMQRFAREADCPVAAISPKLQAFLKQMLHRGILVPEEVVDKVRALDERQALFCEGQTVDHYRIETAIADRRQLELYRAVDLRDDRPVVIKAVNPDADLRPKYKRRKQRVLIQEFELLRELRAHPAVCQFYALHAGPEHYYGVMEPIAGQSLRREIKRAAPDTARRIDLVGQMLSVMAHVHAHGILHGDLHNSNFLVQPDGRVRLIDFDLANHRRRRKGELYRQGGVHEYIPPERLDGRTFRLSKRRPDYRAEVHQIGVILYYILYGELPFTAFTWKELVEKITHEKPTLAPCSPAGDPYPKPLLKILRRCLRKSPKRRFKSAVTLARAWRV